MPPFRPIEERFWEKVERPDLDALDRDLDRYSEAIQLVVSPVEMRRLIAYIRHLEAQALPSREAKGAK